MSVTPVNLARVSHNLRAFNLLNTLRGSQVDLFRTQNQLATGLRFARPSEDPTRATQAITLDRRLDVLNQVAANLQQVTAVLREGESAMQTAVELATEAHTLALQTVSESTSPDERQSLRVVVDALIEQLIAIGNRRYLDTFLFSGHYGDDLPFAWVAEGVLFRGDAGRLETIVDSDLTQESFTISGQEFFNAVSSAVQGYVDLDPALTSEVRLADLNGATGSGVSTGRILVSDGNTEVEIDLSGADTLGDVIDRLNAELPDSLKAELTTRGIDIVPLGAAAGQITIRDVAGGNTAVELGIYTDTPARRVSGADLDPRLTPRTALADLNGGAGITLDGGITIRVGGEVAQISFEGAETIEDLLNRINQAGIGVLAEIGADGRSLAVRNRVSGATLSIEENGGGAASALGIRSMHAGTPLAELNDGRGVATVDGDDLRITTADGTTIDIDLDALDLDSATLQDVIDLINAQAGGAVTAGLATTGNGLRIVDNTTGTGTLRIERLNLSPALDGLGLNVSATGNVRAGQDVNPVKVNSVFTALLELRAALDADDTRGISAAGERLAAVLEHMREVQGALAAKAAAMEARSQRVADEVTATRVLQSDVRDADLGEAVVRFQQVQTALQANLVTASRVMGLSLLDYLR